MKSMAEMVASSTIKTSSSAIAIDRPVWKRDPLIINKRIVRSPTMIVETTQKLADVKEDDKELEIAHF